MLAPRAQMLNAADEVCDACTIRPPSRLGARAGRTRRGSWPSRTRARRPSDRTSGSAGPGRYGCPQVADVKTGTGRRSTTPRSRREARSSSATVGRRPWAISRKSMSSSLRCAILLTSSPRMLRRMVSIVIVDCPARTRFAIGHPSTGGRKTGQWAPDGAGRRDAHTCAGRRINRARKQGTSLLRVPVFCEHMRRGSFHIREHIENKARSVNDLEEQQTRDMRGSREKAAVPPKGRFLKTCLSVIRLVCPSFPELNNKNRLAG